MNDKYEIVRDGESRQSKVASRLLYRVRALRNVGSDVRAGDVGGWVEDERSLSTFGESWIYDEATCYFNGRVSRNAQLRDRATCYAGGYVGDDATVSGNARVSNARVDAQARVFDDAQVCGNALVTDRAQVGGSIKLSRNAIVAGDSIRL